jgi:hypothetical protein
MLRLTGVALATIVLVAMLGVLAGTAAAALSGPGARARIGFKLRNLPHRLRGWRAEVNAWLGVGVLPALTARVTRADGTVVDYGLLSRRFITTAGVTFLTNCFLNTAEPETINFHGMGTGAVAEAIADTALGAEVETRVAGTQSAFTANQYRTVATLTATAARVITEHGLFSAATVSTLWDRSVFAAMNLAIGDSIQFTYTVTFTAGG